MTDITYNADRDYWLAVGWFTPDYRHLADRLSTQLVAQDAPHHLFEVPTEAAWSTLRKPAIMLKARELYPSKILVLMDADCLVSGSLEPMLSEHRANVSFYLGVKQGRGKPVQARASSRVVIVSPTIEGTRFLRAWEFACSKKKGGGDEGPLITALARVQDVTYQPINPAYSAREWDDAPAGAVITHKAETQNTPIGRCKRWLKRTRRSLGYRTTHDLARA